MFECAFQLFNELLPLLPVFIVLILIINIISGLLWGDK